nr:unnamed protein product [Callosobruchus chinensis]
MKINAPVKCEAHNKIYLYQKSNENGKCKQRWILAKSRKYFSLSNLLTLYKAQIRPSLEYCSHIWGAAAPTTLSILDAVQRRAIRLIGDPAFTCHLQPLSHRRAVGDLSLLYGYLNGFYSSELTSIIPPLSKAARCTRGTCSSHPNAIVLHTSSTFIPRVSRAWNGLPEWQEINQTDRQTDQRYQAT